jgi:hypothetical protein
MSFFQVHPVWNRRLKGFQKSNPAPFVFSGGEKLAYEQKVESKFRFQPAAAAASAAAAGAFQKG